MTNEAVTGLITDAIASFGGSAITVLTAVVGLGVGFMLFNWAYRKLRGSAK